MAIPSITQTIRDPGLPPSPAAITSFLYLGTAQQGSVAAIGAFSNAADVVDAYGQGPLAEDLCYHLAIAGGPVYGLRMTGGVAATTGSVTKTAVSGGTGTGTITVAGTALDSYDVKVEIKVTGTLAAAQFVYSLDGGITYSPQTIVPSGATYVLTGTGLTLTFVPGAGAVYFEKGDVHTFSSVEPSFNATNLADAMTVVKADNTPIAAIVLSGKIATASAAATLAAAVSTHATALFQLYRPVRFIMDSGGDNTSTTLTAFAAFSSDRVSKCYGRAVTTSGKPMIGFSAPSCSIVRALAARCAGNLISTDAAWYSLGALPGVTSITHDEFRTELMDVATFSTLRTHQGIPGYFPTKMRLSSLPGSDHKFFQHGRVMDVATATSYLALLPFLSSSVRTVAGGKVDPRDAATWESKLRDALRSVLLDPDNAQGYPGHVSALDVSVDTNTNVLTTGIIKVKVAIQPLGYTDFIDQVLSFSANVGGGQ